MSDAALSCATLAPRSPLEGLQLPTEPRFTLAEAPPAARFTLRGADAVRMACAMAFGAELPVNLGRAGEGLGRAALWLGPDEWLLLAEGADSAALGDVLESVLDGTAHSLVDVSHRQVGLIANGSVAARALSAGCPLDLRLSAFPVGMATRTIFDKAEVALWRRGEDVFHVEVGRSFAPYCVTALTEAARRAPEG